MAQRLGRQLLTSRSYFRAAGALTYLNPTNLMTMTPTILQRIYTLVDRGAHLNAQTAASICRYLTSDRDAAIKAHGITGVLRKLSAADQSRILDAVESLYSGDDEASHE